MSDKPIISEEDMKRSLSARLGERSSIAPVTEPVGEENEELPVQQVPPSRIKRSNQSDFKTLFFNRIELEDRQPLYVSRKVHERITAIVNEVGGRKATVSGYVENIMLNHLETYKAEIDKLYEDKFKHLLK